MKTINEYTDFLFNCNYFDESFDPEDHEDHLKASWELFESFTWDEIYSNWMKYLHSNCHTASDIINFANLYLYYEATDYIIPDPIKFISYLYYRVDMDKYWDVAGDLFDSIAISILSSCKLISLADEPYYSPLKDDRILAGIQQWESQ